MVTLPSTIAEMLASRARLSPERVAFRSTAREALTWGDLQATALRARLALRERGVSAHGRVALALPNGPEAAVAFLATAAAATCAPLNPSYKEADFGFSFSDLGVEAVVVGASPIPQALAAARSLSLPVLTLAPDANGELALQGDGVGAAASPGEPAGEDVAFVLHTSGTTARPKIVPLTHQNLLASAANVARTLRLDERDVCLSLVPLFHIHGLVAAVLASLHAGAEVVCTSGFRSAEFPRWLRELAPTWYTAVPTIHQAALQAMLADEASGSDGGRLRLVRSSSAALPARVHRELEERFRVPIVEAYGMTEASHQMASNPIGAGLQKAGSVGLAAGPEIAVLDEAGRPLAPGAVGEIAIRGETVTKGYENAPEANEAAFVNGWFRTGDQGYLDDDGYLFLTGRLKELINRGGEKIAPREVEEALLRHEAVAQAVAFAAPHARLGEDVAAAIVLRADASATADEVRRTARAHLADFKVPRRIEIVAEIPKGATGKLQRSGLAQALGLVEGLGRPAAALPRTPLEKRVAETWLALLGRSGVGEGALGVDDDFFEVGGDSLAAALMIERMREVLELDVPIADFLERPTIAGLLELRERAWSFGARLPDLAPIRSGGAGAPIFCTTLHDGSLWRVGRMMRLVPADCPVYGFRAPAVGAREPLSTIESLAERNLATLDEVQPHGPVRLVGPCFGGTVALEMAIRLERRGRPVELLAMINSFNRGWRNVSPDGPRLVLRARHLVDRVRLLRERLEGQSAPERLAYLRRRADLARAHWTDEAGRLAFELATRSGLPRPRAVRKIGYAHRRAQRLYSPAPYSGSVLLVRTTEPIAGVYPLDRMGWAEVLRGDVEELDLPGEQLDFWGDDAMLGRAAARIGEILARS
ncbi:MAG: AMP-binding protein [Deltaproteobacteria bacterium]|nr:AMP-binding protein [Deltaproteobacteria bacterium]